jgi:hypothetical protein
LQGFLAGLECFEVQTIGRLPMAAKMGRRGRGREVLEFVVATSKQTIFAPT